MDSSPDDSIMKANEEHAIQTVDWKLEEPEPASPRSNGKSGVFNVIVSGMALFSDGYNAQISTNTLQK